MAGGVTFAVEGLSDVISAFNELAEEIGDKKARSRVLIPAMRKAMQPVLADAKAKAPVDTGALVKHLQVEARRPNRKDQRSKYIDPNDAVIAAVTTKAFPKKLRAQFFEQNKSLLESNPSAYQKKFKKFAISQGFPYDARAMAQEFGSARNPAHPFLRPALENNATQVANNLGKTLGEQITRYRTRTKR
jgi:HK97 gp10 family phage protein